jgi:hypothetical protein
LEHSSSSRPRVIAAIVQLRHARSSNHIAALNELRETMETPDFVAAQAFVLTQLSASRTAPNDNATDAGESIWENFELLTVMSEDFGAAHPAGTYPRGVRRKEIKDEFFEADRQYAASLATA